jgi:DNA-binding Lrp family transcriptional regulator
MVDKKELNHSRRSLMAIRAFMLVETVVGGSNEVVAALRNLKPVKSADRISGPYDAIVTVEAETLTAIGEVVLYQIHGVNGIIRTVTCLAL